MYILLSLAFAVSCGMVFPLQKLVIMETQPLYAVALRFIVTAICVLPFLKSTKGQTLKILAAASLFMVIPFAAQGYAMNSVDAGICAMSTQLAPVLLIVFGVLFLGESVNFIQVGGIILAFFGTGFITISPEISAMPFVPVLALGVAVISYSAGTLVLRSIKLNPVQTMLWGYLFASFQLAFLSSMLEQNILTSFAETDFWLYGISLFIGVLSIGGNGLLTYLVGNYDLNKVMPFALTLPFFSVLGGWALLGEVLHFQAFIGGGLVFLGVLIVIVKGKKKSVSETQRDLIYEKVN